MQKYDASMTSGERHQRHGSAGRAMLRQVKSVRAGKERRKSERRAEQDSGKAKRSSSRSTSELEVTGLQERALV